MPGMFTLLSVVGARPQFVKLAPFCRALAGQENVTHLVVHTGQHYDDNMSATFFAQLEIPSPDHNLGIGSGSQAAQTAAMMTSLESLFDSARPDVVFTFGDTNSTLAATLAASKLHVHLAHVEAGLRSFNRSMPEEINRLVADHCSDRLYAPTPAAMDNLEVEHLLDRAIMTGDIMRDVVYTRIESANRQSHVLDDLEVEPRTFGLVTVHRPANTREDSLPILLANLEKTAQKQKRLVFPVHPRTQAAMEKIGYRPPETLRLIPPQSYLDMLRLTDAAAFVITDSGGLQKEAAFLGRPCVTVRDETEWVETIALGINRLAGYGGVGLFSAVAEILADDCRFDDETMRDLDEFYGTGNAAGKIVADCLEWISGA